MDSFNCKHCAGADGAPLLPRLPSMVEKGRPPGSVLRPFGGLICHCCDKCGNGIASIGEKQDEINGLFLEFREVWRVAVSESDKTEAVFIASGAGAPLLYQWAVSREIVEDVGYALPILVKGLTAALVGDESE